MINCVNMKVSNKLLESIFEKMRLFIYLKFERK